MNDDRYVLLDSKDGTIIRGMGNDLDRIITADSYIHTKGREKIVPVVKIEYKYVKFNNAVAPKIYKECPQVLLLLKFLSYKENSLIFPNGTYINQTNLAKALGFSRVYICELFKELKRKRVLDVMKKNGRNIYILNPYIATKGNEVYAEVLEKFAKTEWEREIEEKGKRNEPEE